MLDYNIEYLFEILDATIHDRKIGNPSQTVDWDEIERIACENKVIPFLYRKIKDLPFELLPSSDKMNILKESSFRLGLRQLMAVNELKKFLSIANSKKIKLILFKGVALAQLYPNCYERSSCDFDILALEEDRDTIQEVLQGLGYSGYKQKEKVQVYERGTAIKLEIHFSLYEDFAGKKIDLLNEMNLADWDKCIEIEMDNVTFKTLGYEEHLIYQLFHIIKHFSFEGISIRYLLDIVLYVDKYHKNIDWKSFWKKMKNLKYDKFAEFIFLAGNKYFGMETMVVEKNVNLYDLEFFICEFMKKNSDEHVRYDSISLLTPYIYDNSKIGKQSKFSVRVSILFPNQESLPARYSYAKKYKWLLPIAWVERMIRHLYAAHIKKKSNSTTYKVECVTEKIILLHKLGLIDE